LCCSPQAFAGIVTVSVGHCHPEVNQAVIEQTHRLQVLRALPLL
jgi:4-aminobutyrate aminotransferase-like enzyme